MLSQPYFLKFFTITPWVRTKGQARSVKWDQIYLPGNLHKLYWWVNANTARVCRCDMKWRAVRLLSLLQCWVEQWTVIVTQSFLGVGGEILVQGEEPLVCQQQSSRVLQAQPPFPTILAALPLQLSLFLKYEY